MKVWINKEFRERFFLEVSSLPLKEQQQIIAEILRGRETRAIFVTGSDVRVLLRGGTIGWVLPDAEKFLAPFLRKYYPEAFL